MTDAALDQTRLENVRTRGEETISACPACREAGADGAGDHLWIGADGRFGCVANPGTTGHRHRQRIFQLVGMQSEPAPRPPQRKAHVKRAALTWSTPEAAATACTPAGFALVTCYQYGDGAAVARYEGATGKTFRQYHADGNRWTIGGPSEPWPLYGVESMPPAGALYVVEGEKAHAAAVSIGLPCVTSAGGSKAASKTDWRHLAGRDVILLPDNDTPGETYAADVSTILAKLTPPAHVRIVRLPGIPAGGDIVDYLEQRDAVEPDAIRAEIESMAATAEPPAVPGALDGAAVLRDDPPPHAPVLAGLFDRHALVELVGPSKTRKSFTVIQLALSLAAGRHCYGFEIGGQFSVCVADMELSEADIRRRLWRMGRALGIGPADIGDRLAILPLAGVENARDQIEVAAAGFDILICDPLYALCDGGENIEDLREPLRWLRRQAVKRAAALFIHHDAKGAAGDRQTRDRGSGSGITGRAVDARITLTPAAADPDNTVVMGFMCRSYVAPPPSAWTFEGDAFRASDLPAEPERQSDQRARAARPKLEGYRPAAVRILDADGPMSPAVFKQRLREELSMSKGDADTLTASLCDGDGEARRWREGGFATAYKIGTRKQFDLASRCLPGGRQEAAETG